MAEHPEVHSNGKKKKYHDCYIAHVLKKLGRTSGLVRKERRCAAYCLHGSIDLLDQFHMLNQMVEQVSAFPTKKRKKQTNKKKSCRLLDFQEKQYTTELKFELRIRLEKIN